MVDASCHLFHWLQNVIVCHEKTFLLRQMFCYFLTLVDIIITSLISKQNYPFLQRTLQALYCYGISSVRLPSHTGIVSKRANVDECGLHHRIAGAKND